MTLTVLCNCRLSLCCLGLATYGISDRLVGILTKPLAPAICGDDIEDHRPDKPNQS